MLTGWPPFCDVSMLMEHTVSHSFRELYYRLVYGEQWARYCSIGRNATFLHYGSYIVMSQFPPSPPHSSWSRGSSFLLIRSYALFVKRGLTTLDAS